MINWILTHWFSSISMQIDSFLANSKILIYLVGHREFWGLIRITVNLTFKFALSINHSVFQVAQIWTNFHNNIYAPYSSGTWRKTWSKIVSKCLDHTVQFIWRNLCINNFSGSCPTCVDYRSQDQKACKLLIQKKWMIKSNIPNLTKVPILHFSWFCRQS